jgi:decaprenyl-phosphate phosphoribosyltransferase
MLGAERAPVDGPPARTAPSLAALLRTARPRQWLKNILVFAAPGAAGVLLHGGILGRAVATFALFCTASAGTYFLNDALDAETDRHHPQKRSRPVAAGIIPAPTALAIGVTLMAAAVGLSALVSARLVIVVAAYVAISGVAYSLWLKGQPVLDIGAVAGGFILRAIAGGVATNVALSDWFLIVASFGSLFLVGGKRYAEHVGLGEEGHHHRATLASYSLSYLRYVRSFSSAVAVAGYCLWAFEKAGSGGHTAPGAIWYQLSIAPFVLAVLRYALVLETGAGGAPEDVILGDRVLQTLGAAWLLLFALGVYGI